MSIAIIGAGITGLTLALQLKNKGFKVTVYESSGQVGGVIKTYQQNEWLAELGPNSILESSTRIKELIDTLELHDELIFTNKTAEKRYVVRKGKPEVVPGTAMQFLKSNLLSNKGKFMIMKEPFLKPKPGDDDESLAAFVRRRLGQEFLDYFVYPFVGGIYSGDPETLSVKHAFKRFYNLEKKYGSIILGQFKAAQEREKHEIPKNKARSFSFKNGLQTLPETLYKKLDGDVRLNARVLSINQIDGAYQLETASEAGTTTTEKYEVVIYAGPAHKLDGIQFEGRGSTSIADLASIKYPAVCSVALGYSKEQIQHPLDGFGVLIPPNEGYKILGTQFSSEVFPGRTPEGHTLLTTFIGGTRYPEAIDKDDNELINIVKNDLSQLLGAQGEPGFVQLTRWENAIPQYEIGYGKFLNAMDSIEEENPGFYLAGNYRTGIAVGDCISSAVDLVERIEKEQSAPAKSQTTIN